MESALALLIIGGLVGGIIYLLFRQRALENEAEIVAINSIEREKRKLELEEMHAQMEASIARFRAQKEAYQKAKDQLKKGEE